MYTLENILESIYNGQRRQAIRQLEESNYIFTDLIRKLSEDDMQEEIILMLNVALREEYLKEK